MLLYKLPLGCLILVLLLMFLYYYEKKRHKAKRRTRLFEFLLAGAVLCFCLDIITVYTVNHLESVPPLLNKVVHLLYFFTIDWCILYSFLYLVALLDISFTKKKLWGMVYIPYGAGLLIMAFGIKSLEYRIGKETNYSMGIPAYVCYILVAYFFILAVLIWFRNRKNIPKGRKITFLLCLPVFMLFMIYQMLYPESLVSSLAITILILGAYCSSENASKIELMQYHNRVVSAFAEVIESRDDSTGEHVKRTTAYVRLIAEELMKRKAFPETLTKAYLYSLMKAAPLHDFGKIAIPDAVLQKKGKLTPEEFEIMKKHTVYGAEMVEHTLHDLEEPEDTEVAYQVAMHHHERWDGKGYPEGLKGEAIPLCARIMAVADVFDAVSQKRCYREAMTLDESFAIIKEGVGSQFDPLIAEVFLQKREDVEKVYKEIVNPGK